MQVLKNESEVVEKVRWGRTNINLEFLIILWQTLFCVFFK